MDKNVLNVPILTLAGINSFSNFLNGLPLPQECNDDNFLLSHHPALLRAQHQLLHTPTSASLVQQLVRALNVTSANHISGTENTLADAPDLIRSLMHQDPTLFNNNNNIGQRTHNNTSAISDLNNKSSKTDLNNFNLLQQQQQLSTTLQQQQLSTTLQQQQLTSSLQQQQQINSLQQQQLNTLQQQQLNSTLQQQLNPALLQQQQHFQQIPNYNQPFPNSEYEYLMNSSNQNLVQPIRIEELMSGTLQAPFVPNFANVSYSHSKLNMDSPGAPNNPLLHNINQEFNINNVNNINNNNNNNMLTHLKQNFNHINNNTGDNNSINLCNDTKTESFGYQQQQQYPPYEDQKPPTQYPSDKQTQAFSTAPKKEDEESKCTPVQTYNLGERKELKITLSKKNGGLKRKSYEDEDNNDSFSQSLSERVKRRRGNVVSYDDNTDEEGADNDLQGVQTERKRQHKEEKHHKRRRHHQHHRTSTLALQDGIDEHLIEGASLHKLYRLLETVFDAAEQADLGALKDEEEEEEDASCLNEPIISLHHLCDISSEAAKLKSVSLMSQIPYERLVKLLTVLRFSIKQGLKPVSYEQLMETDEDQLYRQLSLERVESSLNACHICLLIMTSQDMPKQVYIEDVIEEVLRCTSRHLKNIIFPLFDPIYRSSASQASIKMRRSKGGLKDTGLGNLYSKMTQLVSLLGELVQLQELTDSLVLQVSALSVSAFFVENIPELQLNALKLVTNVFSKYEKHRQLILEDILSSLARLPSSKKNVRTYRLNSEENIQMLTALALQLIQCVIKIPRKTEPLYLDEDEEEEVGENKGVDNDEVAKERIKRMLKQKSLFTPENESMILSSYDTSIKTAHNFLHVFLAKCSSKEEEDYRSIFSNFVNDLLSTVNKPQWPASELLLSILGTLLVKQFSSKSVEMSLRVASLDYLGIVAARLRKDAVNHNIDDLDTLVNKLVDKKEDEEEEEGSGFKKQNKSSHRTEVLQKGLLSYLAAHSLTDPSLIFASKFYIAQWFRDCRKEIEKSSKKEDINKKKKKIKKKVKHKKHKTKNRGRNAIKSEDEDDDETEEDEEEEEEDEDKTEEEDNNDCDDVIKEMVQRRKKFLFDEVELMSVKRSAVKQSSCKLDKTSAQMVTRYLASNRPFCQSFDIYLTQILKVLEEHAVAVRSRALKCLAAVVEADASVLARRDMQTGVHNRFLDNSTSVREAVVELVGKFIIVQPSLTLQYYDMLSSRILDKGISVRKRVIKIFRDICLQQPSFPKIPEMCVKMVCRVNDEEGIRKVVNETFESMWFIPCASNQPQQPILLQKVSNISKVVSLASSNIGFDWLEQLMTNLLKKEEGLRDKPVWRSCEQLVDCMVFNLSSLELKHNDNIELASCFITLFLFCKVQPLLLVKHCTTIHPYLNIKFSHQSDSHIVSSTLKMLQLSVPLLEHPGEMFLAKLEEDVAKLILKHGTTIIQNCISCLASIVNDITHNYKLVFDCFSKFYSMTVKIREWQETGIDPRLVEGVHTKLRRSLFVTGLLCKYFDFDQPHFVQLNPEQEEGSMKDKVFDLLVNFLHFPDLSVQLKSLAAIGFLATRHYDLMLSKQLRDIYHLLLTFNSHQNNELNNSNDISRSDSPEKMMDTSNDASKNKVIKSEEADGDMKDNEGMYLSASMRSQVLINLRDYLVEEEEKMARADVEWRKQQEKEDLKEMGDVQSGMASTIVQVYLKQILESFFYLDQQVRMSALDVVVLILSQGLVHPQQCMAHLISMGSDPVPVIRLKADKQIQEIDKKYPGFVQAKAMQGIKMSCRLQKLLHKGCCLRGARRLDDGSFTSLNSFIYSVVKSNKSNRRVLLMNALKMFEESTPLEELLYMSDNLAYFPYQLQEEALFIMHHIDLILSVSGSNLLQSFKEVFFPPQPISSTTHLLQHNHYEQHSAQQQHISQPPFPNHHQYNHNSPSHQLRPTINNLDHSATNYNVNNKNGYHNSHEEDKTISDIGSSHLQGVHQNNGPNNNQKNLNNNLTQNTNNQTENDNVIVINLNTTNMNDVNARAQTPTNQKVEGQKRYDDDDDDLDVDTLMELVPKDTRVLCELHRSLQGYRLMLALKQHLKDMYGFTDRKIQMYSLSDSKLYEKPVNRKHNVIFQPKNVIKMIEEGVEEDVKKILTDYVDFKELMSSIDQEDLSDDGAKLQSSPEKTLNKPIEPFKRASKPIIKKTAKNIKQNKKVKKKKKKKLNYDEAEEDDDDDDEDDADYDESWG